MIKIQQLFVLFFVLSASAAGWTFAAYPSENDTPDVDTAVVAERLMAEIEFNVQAVSGIIDSIVEDLEAGNLDVEFNGKNKNTLLEDRLENGVTLIENLLELGFALEPEPSCSSRRLYARAYQIKNGRVVKVRTDEVDDYVPEMNSEKPSGKSKGWFLSILPATRGIWLKPELDSVSDIVSVRYGRSFQTPENDLSSSKKGVVYAVWNIKDISDLLKNTDLGSNGYANLQTKDGDFLVHYHRDCIFKSKEDDNGDNCNIESAASVRLNLPSTEWILTVETDTQPDLQNHRRSIFHRSVWGICLFSGTIIFCIVSISFYGKKKGKWYGFGNMQSHEDTAILLNRSAPDKSNNAILWRWRVVLWIFSISVILGAGLLLSFYYKWPNTPELTQKIIKVDSQYRLDKFWKQHQEKVYRYCNKLPVAVPTGIFIQSMTFTDAYNVRLTGHIWQKYTDGVHDGISRGFILPESEEATIEHLYTKRIGNTEVWGWRFNVVVCQEFDYLRYPFGSEDIWIQIWHKDFYSNVVLTPDYDSYKLILPNMKPGVRRGLEIPGWNIKSTFFGYLNKDYNTNFGQASFDGVTEFPELYFNVMIEKQIIAPLVSYLLPVVFLWGMMYAILLLSSRYKQQADAYGFNAMNVVTACAGFFLVVVFCHVDLRSHIVSKNINYLEYYYFIAYMLIVFVIANAIILTLSKFGLTHYKNNLIPKIAYWPFLSIIIFIITLKIFY